ncbi:hypothetical protein TNCV_3850121 [Trichonephila clavipes]|nr:hypothetical protein TNCV_3850121 [Trichonephila clavipes]
MVLQHINFCTAQSIAKLPSGSPKMMPTWLNRQHFVMFPLNRYYNLILALLSLYGSFAQLYPVLLQGLEVERPGLRVSLLIGGLEQARGCGYGDCFGDTRCD